MSDQGNYRYDVFISYSHVDRDWVWDELLPRLEQAGLRVCIDDRDFEIGTPSLINMERAVDNSRHTLAVLTPAWLESQWAEFESLLVGSTDPAGRRRRLFPFILKCCNLPPRINALTPANPAQSHPYVDQLERLVTQLQGTQEMNGASPSYNSHSPFIVGPPTTHPRHFFGRERELKRLFGLWRGLPLQNAAIIGPRRSGKTSLLWYLKTITTTPPEQLRPGQQVNWLPQPERYRWIFVDFQDPRLHRREGLLRYLLQSLDMPIPTPCDLDYFIDVVSHRLRSPTVILLDEIGVALQRCPELDNDFWEGLRSLAINQVQGNLAFVMASHESPQQLAKDSGQSSPFFNIFGYTTTLGPLRETEARSLIASAPLFCSETDSEWILQCSKRWPILLQILCRERLIALESGEADNTWQEEGLDQLEPFRHLLDIP